MGLQVDKAPPFPHKASPFDPHNAESQKWFSAILPGRKLVLREANTLSHPTPDLLSKDLCFSLPQWLGFLGSQGFP
jgi:hypothetical protein